MRRISFQVPSYVFLIEWFTLKVSFWLFITVWDTFCYWGSLWGWKDNTILLLMKENNDLFFALFKQETPKTMTTVFFFPPTNCSDKAIVKFRAWFQQFLSIRLIPLLKPINFAEKRTIISSIVGVSTDLWAYEISDGPAQLRHLIFRGDQNKLWRNQGFSSQRQHNLALSRSVQLWSEWSFVGL